MADSYVLDMDYQRDYVPEELFNVEFYCTRKMEVIFPAFIGFIVCLVVVFCTLASVLFTVMMANKLTSVEWIKWLELTLISIAVYGFCFELLKCIIYFCFQVFKDSF